MSRVGVYLFLVSILGATPVAAQYGAFDVATLVGEWNGTWDSTNWGSGTQYLTIKQIDGDRVTGTVYISAPRSRAKFHNRDVAVQGTLVVPKDEPPTLNLRLPVAETGDPERGYRLRVISPKKLEGEAYGTAQSRAVFTKK